NSYLTPCHRRSRRDPLAKGRHFRHLDLTHSDPALDCWRWLASERVLQRTLRDHPGLYVLDLVRQPTFHPLGDEVDNAPAERAAQQSFRAELLVMPPRVTGGEQVEVPEHFVGDRAPKSRVRVGPQVRE